MHTRLTFAVASRTIFALCYWIAEHKGYFRDEGIDLALEEIPDSRRIASGLRSGAITLAVGSPDDVILDALAGGPLRIVAGNAGKPPLFLIAQPEITSLARLRGARIGVLSLREGSVKLIPKFAAAGGLKPSDYTIVEVGGAPARKQLLLDRQIDAGLQPMPLNYEAESVGFVSLGWSGAYEPDYQFSTFNANAQSVRDDGRHLIAILRALLRAQRFTVAHVEEAADIAALELRSERQFALQALHENARLGIIDPQLDWSEAGLARIYDSLREDNRMTSPVAFDIERLVAREYLHLAKTSLEG